MTGQRLLDVQRHIIFARMMADEQPRTLRFFHRYPLSPPAPRCTASTVMGSRILCRGAGASVGNGMSGRSPLEIGRAVQQECRDRSRMPSSA
eukprot:TRINITY_DN27319_c0_g1_i1.p1 TRINITY_DN27319_c0_g1~~TRINITY_DN27319_c0_g1_i1.p1  ORF type:complete len:100 (+),score=12.37 TRINITY_DN27319_c0_g1_i1:27-302(+)